MPCEDDILINVDETTEEITVNITECDCEGSFPEISENTLLGREPGVGDGQPQEITIGTGLELDGTTLNVTISGSSGETSYRRHFMFMGG